MSKKYNNAITTTAGFNYAAQQPLDDRAVVENYNDLSELISSGVSYEGMEVYVVADKKSYKLIDGDWKAVATEEDLNNLIGCGTADPTASMSGRFYFKYSME